MNSYERKAVLWLRHELAAELGLTPVRTGRRNALRPDDERRVFSEVMATPRRRRGQTYLRLARELGVGVSTLQSLVHRLKEDGEGSMPRNVSQKPRNPTVHV